MTTFERVQAIVAKHAGIDVEKVTEDASLSDDLGLDSLDSVEIAIKCDDAFKIDLKDEDIDAAFTVGDIVKAVEGLLPTTA